MALIDVTIIASNSEFNPAQDAFRKSLTCCLQVPFFYLNSLIYYYYFFSSAGYNFSQSVVTLCGLEAEWSHIHSAVPPLTTEHCRQSLTVTSIENLLVILNWPLLASLHQPSGMSAAY